MKFLNIRIHQLTNKYATNDEASTSKNGGFKSDNKQKSSTVLVSTTTAASPCACNENHMLFKCPAFLNKTTAERIKLVRDSKRCINCLKPGHITKNCTSRKCMKCSKPHNTLLHIDQKKREQIPKAEKEQKTVLCSQINTDQQTGQVFLATVMVTIIDRYGEPMRARALLDSGSQLNFMTKKLLRKLKLEWKRTSIDLLGIGNIKTETNKRTMVKIQSSNGNFNEQMEFYILNQVANQQPENYVDIRNWNLQDNIQLADPQFNKPATVDLILGGEYFFNIIKGETRSIGNGLPILQQTEFGWAVVGKSNTTKAFAGIATKTTLEEQLAKFWEIEEKTEQRKPMTMLEERCEKFYENTTKRDRHTGKFLVKLQFTKPPSTLGSSDKTAMQRFFQLENRFKKDPILKANYLDFMREYERLGHMTEVNSSKTPPGYIIPHHAVFKPDSTTTKLRAVFDGSAKTSNNISLNDIMANGPVLQDDLFSILVRFRTHQYAISADVTKMYRQVLVAPDDRQWQQIIWREQPFSPLKYYQLNTLTYGITCASYLAIKSLQTLASQNSKSYQLASAKALKDFNVDDLITGTNNLDDCKQLQREMIDMCSKAGLQLHKWCANHQDLLKGVPAADRGISLELGTDKLNQETKALGIKWIPKTDTFRLAYEPTCKASITKRNVLSETAQLFDPLGIVNPVIIMAKVFMQECWNLKIDWDTLLPDTMQRDWIKYREDLLKLNQVSFSRRIIIKDAVDIQLHGFSDASQKAYGTCYYLRSTDKNGNIQCNLVCSKSRVAPVSTLTLPRLELCGGTTMVKLGEKLKTALGIELSKENYWTDSEIVLSWVLKDGNFKTFVANRVAAIHRKTKRIAWKYVNTKENPADLISRGMLPNELINSELWWHGPSFLRKPETQWPDIKPKFRRDENEEMQIKTILLTQKLEEKHFMETINHRNSIHVLKRIIAYMQRMIPKRQKISSKIHSETSELQLNELKRAMTYIIKYAQQEGFEKEINLVRQGLSTRTKFSSFSPIIDADGIIRVGGRLQNADMTFEQKHPIPMPKNHFVTLLIMEGIHIDNKHAGAQALLAITRQRYLPESGKELAQRIVRNCVICARSKPILMQQIMGDLPKERVKIAHAFINVSLDFFGPINIHHRLRGRATAKGYACIFVCLSTKATHIEPANDTSIDGFINCLKRFVARRSAPSKIICDNATNFRGAYIQSVDRITRNDDRSKQH